MSIDFSTNNVTSRYEIDMGTGANWSNPITATLESTGDFVSASTVVHL